MEFIQRGTDQNFRRRSKVGGISLISSPTNN